MHPLIKKLIAENFDSLDTLPESFFYFLDGLNKALENQGEEVIPDSLPPASVKPDRESHTDLVNNTINIIKNLQKIESLSELYTSLTKNIVESFGFIRAQYFSYIPAGNNLKLIATYGENEPLIRSQHAIIPLAKGVIGNAVTEQMVTVLYRDQIDSDQYHQLISKFAQSIYVVPFASEKELTGCLIIQSVGHNTFTEETQLHIENLALQVSILAERIQSKIEMQDQLEELNFLQHLTSAESWKSFSEISEFSSNPFPDDSEHDSTLLPKVDREKSLQKQLEVRGEVIGALNVESSDENPLSEEEQKLLDSISAEVAEALERARLFETSQRSAAELAILNEMGTIFSQTLDEVTITEAIYTYTAKLMEAPQFYVALYNDEEEKIYFPYVVMDDEKVTEEHPDFSQWVPRTLGSSLTGYIVKSKQPILIDSRAVERLKGLDLPYQSFGGETQSWLGVPMIIGNRVLGVISVQCDNRPNLYNFHHQDLLTVIASQAAVAINNVRLFNQEQERAQQERTVRTITDKVHRETSTQGIMETALKELSQILNADLSSIQLGDPQALITSAEPDEHVTKEEEH